MQRRVRAGHQGRKQWFFGGRVLVDGHQQFALIVGVEMRQSAVHPLAYLAPGQEPARSGGIFEDAAHRTSPTCWMPRMPSLAGI